MKDRIISPTWKRMTEAERDRLRSSFRRMVAGMAGVKDELPPSHRRIIEAMDACLMEDRIELGGALAGLMTIEDLGRSDIASELIGQIYERIDPTARLNPERN